jgi:hypothetical protein
MKINVCNMDLGEIRQFEHVDFDTSVRKARDEYEGAKNTEQLLQPDTSCRLSK